jgi:hypothetical protein
MLPQGHPLSRPVRTIEEFGGWLDEASALVNGLPDKNKAGNERTTTHDSAPLCRVAERLHDLCNEYAPGAAERCTLPGRPSHFSKAEVLRNLRLAREELRRSLTSTPPAKAIRRGRRQESDPNVDGRLCEDWKAAKGQGMTRDAFARERGITVQELIDAQHRQKYRRTRDAEQ